MTVSPIRDSGSATGSMKREKRIALSPTPWLRRNPRRRYAPPVEARRGGILQSLGAVVEAGPIRSPSHRWRYSKGARAGGISGAAAPRRLTPEQIAVDGPLASSRTCRMGGKSVTQEAVGRSARQTRPVLGAHKMRQFFDPPRCIVGRRPCRLSPPMPTRAATEKPDPTKLPATGLTYTWAFKPDAQSPPPRSPCGMGRTVLPIGFDGDGAPLLRRSWASCQALSGL